MARSLELLGVDINQVQSTTASLEFRPGIRLSTDDGGEWVYVRAASAIGSGCVCVMSNAGSGSLDFVPLQDNNRFGGPVAVSLNGIASGGYGWLQRAGLAPKLAVEGSAAYGTNISFTVGVVAGALKKYTAANGSSRTVTGIWVATSATVSVSCSTFGSAPTIAGYLDYPRVLNLETSGTAGAT